MQNVRIKLDLVYAKKPKAANTIQCLSLNLTLVFAASVMLGPNAHQACRKARRTSDADGRLPYMRSPIGPPLTYSSRSLLTINGAF